MNFHKAYAKIKINEWQKCVNPVLSLVFCYGNEKNAHRACTRGRLTTANQSGNRKAYLDSVQRAIRQKGRV